MTAGDRRRRTGEEILADLDAHHRLRALHAEPDAAPAEPVQWEGEPVPLTARRLLPPFPVDVLPGWLADMVAAVAEFTQTPLDLPGCLALACLAAAAGGRATVEVRPGWREPVNLYVVVALPPGSRKSPVFTAMTGPVLTAEARLVEAARPRIVDAELALRIARADAEHAARAAETATGDARTEKLADAAAAALAAQAITVPPVPRLVADDITAEAAASLLAEQGGRLAVLSAEGGIFATIAGRYPAPPTSRCSSRGTPVTCCGWTARAGPPNTSPRPR